MVTAAEIQDEASLRAWLKGRPREDAVAIAARAALRVVQMRLEFRFRRGGPKYSGLLRDLRALLVALLWAARPSKNVSQVAIAAAHADHSEPAFAAAALVFQADQDRIASFRSLIDRARELAWKAGDGQGDGRESGDLAADFAVLAFTGALDGDLRALEEGKTLAALPLWSGQAQPPWLVSRTEREIRERAQSWEFWADWYEGYLTGRPLDLDLLEKVALIPNEAWEKGDAHVNAIIAHIYDQFRGSGSSLGQPRLSLPLVTRQAAVLRDYVLAELERIRGHNEWSASDLPRVERVKELLEEALSAVNAILESLDDPSTSTEDALVVVEQKLPAVVEAAENLSSETASPKISEPMLAIAATVKVLTDAGLDPKDAGRLAAADVLGPKLLVWFKSFWRKKA